MSGNDARLLPGGNIYVNLELEVDPRGQQLGYRSPKQRDKLAARCEGAFRFFERTISDTRRVRRLAAANNTPLCTQCDTTKYHPCKHCELSG
jgi:hypothetical protein